MVRDPHVVELDPQRDKPAIFAWLRSHLRWHLEAWSRAVGLHWSRADIDAHIDSHGLVERDWNELEEASRQGHEFVGVARMLGRPIGVIHAREREDRYLRIRMGVVCWIFVEPVSRGSGVSQLLLRAGRVWMQERGLRVAEVFVTAENLAAVSAYRRSGYELVDHRFMARLGDMEDE